MEKGEINNKTKKNPVWLPSFPHVYDLESRLLSGLHNDRKQAGLSLYGEWV